MAPRWGPLTKPRRDEAREALAIWDCRGDERVGRGGPRTVYKPGGETQVERIPSS